MKQKIAKLIDVKSIMTLMLTAVFCVLALLGVISAEQFVTIFTVIVGFYFGTQSNKQKTEPAPVQAVQQYVGPEQGESLVIPETITEDMAKQIHPDSEAPCEEMLQ